MFRYDGIYILTHNKNKIKVEGQYSPSLPLHRVFQGVGGGGLKGKYQVSGAGGTRSPPATSHHLQNYNGHQGATKWPTGSGKWSIPWFLGAPVNFR